MTWNEALLQTLPLWRLLLMLLLLLLLMLMLLLMLLLLVRPCMHWKGSPSRQHVSCYSLLSGLSILFVVD